MIETPTRRNAADVDTQVITSASPVANDEVASEVQIASYASGAASAKPIV